MCDSEDDFESNSSTDQSKPGAKVRMEKKKKVELFNPKINQVKSKKSDDNYRLRKGTLKRKGYDLMRSAGVSVALVVARKQFSEEIEIAGGGFTLDEVVQTCLTEDNFLPDSESEDEEPGKLEDYKKLVFSEVSVLEDHMEAVDSFLQEAFLKTKGKKIAEKRLDGIDENAHKSGAQENEGAGGSGI